jgi:hypothetical protein
VKTYLLPLVLLQPLFLPALAALIAWAVWRTVKHKDLVVGLALYLGLVIIVDTFMNTGIYLPGLEKGSIRYSEVCAAFLIMNRPPPRPASSSRFLLVSAVCVYFAILMVSVARTDVIVPAIMQFRAIIIPQIIALLIVARGFNSPKDYQRFVPFLALLVFLITAFDFFDIFFDRWLLHSDSLYTSKYFMNRKAWRFGSFFLNPNMLGAFMVLLFPALFVWALNEPIRWRRCFAWMSLLCLALSRRNREVR